MPGPYHFLTTPERDLVQDTINRVRHQFGGDPAGFAPPNPVSTAQVFYMARLLDDEVLPAFNATTKAPGWKICNIYKIAHDPGNPDSAKPDRAFYQQIVWNIYRLPILGVADDNGYYFQVNKDAFGHWFCERPTALVAKANANINPGSSGTVTIQKGSPGSEIPTSVTAMPFNRTSIVWAAGKFGGVDLVNGLVYGFPWECPPSA